MSPARESEPRYKTAARDGWWTPPDFTPLCAPIPYVAPIVEDALSITEQRILRVITNLKLGARKQSGSDGVDRGYICDPGGYDRIAKNAGTCRKTAYNVVKSLTGKKALRVIELVERGGQRVKTLYFAPHYGDVLVDWRADPTLFKTDRGSVVVRGRAKVIQTVANAAEWKIDPKRAPKRGCGRARNVEDESQEALFEDAPTPAKTAPTPPPAQPKPVPQGTDDELAAVYAGFQAVSRVNLQDAMDLVARAHAEANRLGARITPALVVGCIEAIAADYKPSPEYPTARPKWFIDKIASYLGHGIAQQRRAFLQTPVSRLDSASRVRFLRDALELRDSGRASPEERAFCNQWIGYIAECAPAELAEAQAGDPQAMAG